MEDRRGKRGESERSSEKEDQLQRSNKKVKMGMGEEGGMCSEYPCLEEGPVRKVSYRDSILGGESAGDGMDCESQGSDDEDWDIDCDDNAEEEGLRDSEDYPVIRLTKEEKFRLRTPWRKSMVIILLGKHIGYNFLCKKLY
ncbi:reverse transcriptase [Quillaja saponaria]|uniref:Reverse transcriptase n=1 Tax=Quillaja saponaria TaxID=32244 RepID=A0AAD7Q6B4_QUISA|nr:reverse transcriptase [Quillaja saponaria]